MKKNDWKDRLNIVYSTNPDFNYQLDEEEEPATVDPKQQKLRVSIEKKRTRRKDRYRHFRIYRSGR